MTIDRCNAHKFDVQRIMNKNGGVNQTIFAAVSDMQFSA